MRNDPRMDDAETAAFVALRLLAVGFVIGLAVGVML